MPEFIAYKTLQAISPSTVQPYSSVCEDLSCSQLKRVVAETLSIVQNAMPLVILMLVYIERASDQIVVDQEPPCASDVFLGVFSVAYKVDNICVLIIQPLSACELTTIIIIQWLFIWGLPSTKRVPQCLPEGIRSLVAVNTLSELRMLHYLGYELWCSQEDVLKQLQAIISARLEALKFSGR